MEKSEEEWPLTLTEIVLCLPIVEQSYELYDEAYQQHLNAPNTLTLAAYLELHNNYVQDVHATNAMADQYHNVILPQLIQVSCHFLFPSSAVDVRSSSSFNR